MTVEQQQTIANEATLEGRGLFMGAAAHVRFRPAPENHGIVFARTDVEPGRTPVRIPALVRHVTKRSRRTTLRVGQTTIETCEHCLSALAGMGIDNVLVEVSGPELPGGDGSAKPFVDVLQRAGTTAQGQPRRLFRIDEPVTVEAGDAMIAALPTEKSGMQVIYDLDYSDAEAGPAPQGFGTQVHAFHLNGRADHYIDHIAGARTYVFEDEAKALQAQGIGKHLTPAEVLVLGPDGPLPPNAFRFDDELVRHKVLDIIGDLALLGCAIRGRIVAYKSGHTLNHRLARKLAQVMTARTRADQLQRDEELDVRRISQILPHRYPMLMIDRVLEVEGNQRAVGVKNVTINEPFFTGHYPGTPIMPGVLIVEAMAQLSGVLLSRKIEHTGKVAVLLSMDRVKLRKPVTPGDQLVIEARTVRVRSRTGHTQCRAHVGADLAAEAEIKFMLVDAEQEN